MRHLKSEILKEKKRVITIDYEEYHREFFVDKYFYQLADECNNLTDTGGVTFIGLPYNMNSEYILKSRMMTTSNNELNPVNILTVLR